MIRRVVHVAPGVLIAILALDASAAQVSLLAAAGLGDVQLHRIDEDPVNCAYIATRTSAEAKSAA